METATHLVRVGYGDRPLYATVSTLPSHTNIIILRRGSQCSLIEIEKVHTFLLYKMLY
jgi:hypothetical protein